MPSNRLSCMFLEVLHVHMRIFKRQVHPIENSNVPMKTFKKYLIHYTQTFSRWSIRVIRFSWYFDNLDGIEQHVEIESKFSSSSICRRPNFFKLLFNFSLNRAYLTVVSVLNVLFERSQCHSNSRYFFDCL